MNPKPGWSSRLGFSLLSFQTPTDKRGIKPGIQTNLTPLINGKKERKQLIKPTFPDNFLKIVTKLNLFFDNSEI